MHICAACTLIIEISWRAARLPAVSIFHAAWSTISRAESISIRDLATKSWTNCFSPSVPPNETRVFARLHISSIARSAAPIARMQWWIRPGPSRSWAITNPPPRVPSRFSSGTRQSSYLISQCPGPPSWPITDTGRTRLNPGASVGTMIMLARLCGGASGSVTTIAIAKSAPTAPDVNHLCPLMTHSPSTSSAREWMFVGSEPDVSGSVIEKQLRLVAVQHRLEELLLLLGRAVLVEDLHVARVGRRAVEDHGRDEAAAHDLAEHPVLPVGQADADLLVRHEEVPEALRLRLLAQLDDRVGIGLAGVPRHLLVQRLDQLALARVVMLVEEAVHALEQRGDAVGGREVQGRRESITAPERLRLW